MAKLFTIMAYYLSYVGRDGTKYNVHTTSRMVNPELIKMYAYINPEHVLAAPQPIDMSSFGMPNETTFRLKYRDAFIIEVLPGTVVRLNHDKKDYMIMGACTSFPVESINNDDIYLTIEKDNVVIVNGMEVKVDQPMRVKLPNNCSVLLTEGTVLKSLNSKRKFEIELWTNTDAILNPSAPPSIDVQAKL